jgi:molybdopterin-guanine dinucleotide biosynthesis protein
MKTICVTGSTSNVGKTYLIERILRRIDSGWGVCKVTICHEKGTHTCPRGREKHCGVCSSLDPQDDYLLVEDPAVLEEEGKDTRRYLNAGAVKVIWVKTRKEYLDRAVAEAADRFSHLEGVIFEGNHALSVLEPDIGIMVVGDPVRYKPSARAILDRIDLTGSSGDRELLDNIAASIETGSSGAAPR